MNLKVGSALGQGTRTRHVAMAHAPTPHGMYDKCMTFTALYGLYDKRIDVAFV